MIFHLIEMHSALLQRSVIVTNGCLCFSTAVPWLLPWSDQDLHPSRRAGGGDVGSFASRRSLADGAQIKA